MRLRYALFGIITVVLLSLVAAYSYRYLVQKPPTWLVESMTKTKPPPALPVGDDAPVSAPSGFKATIFSRDTPGARVMIRDSKGTMLVSETKGGKVVALPDKDDDGKADGVHILIEGLKQPHGLLVRCESTAESASTSPEQCTLYVAATGELRSYSYDADTLTATYQKTLTSFPTGEGHFTRTLLMHPDGKHILISVGSSCNVCNETDARRASILSYDTKTGQVVTIATGLRNSVFLAVDPLSDEVWATDNGRDVLGDDIPPDEVNIIREGNNYGWPMCYGDNIHDTDFDLGTYAVNPCDAMTPPHIELQAHSAALGLTFIPEEGWPKEMHGDLLIAYHGSWNRSVPTGYKVVRFDLDNNRNASVPPADFLTGFLAEGAKIDDSIGRPAGLLAEPGGVVYVSDDRAGAIYKISLTSQE